MAKRLSRQRPNNTIQVIEIYEPDMDSMVRAIMLVLFWPGEQADDTASQGCNAPRKPVRQDGGEEDDHQKC
jgi:hypothetical protein